MRHWKYVLFWLKYGWGVRKRRRADLELATTPPLQSQKILDGEHTIQHTYLKCHALWSGYTCATTLPTQSNFGNEMLTRIESLGSKLGKSTEEQRGHLAVTLPSNGNIEKCEIYFQVTIRRRKMQKRRNEKVQAGGGDKNSPGMGALRNVRAIGSIRASPSLWTWPSGFRNDPALR